MQTELFFAVLRGRIADNKYFGNHSDFVADIDTEKYYFRMISALNLDKGGGSAKRVFREQDGGGRQPYGRGSPALAIHWPPEVDK